MVVAVLARSMQLPVSRAAAGALAALVARAHLAHQLTGHMLEQVPRACMAAADSCLQVKTFRDAEDRQLRDSVHKCLELVSVWTKGLK